MEINIGVILASIVNTAILYMILKHFFFDKVKAVINEREEYINKTFLYSKKNIAGFEILDKDDSDFRILLHYDEAIEFIKNQGGKIYNAEIYEKEIDNFGKVIYDIKADGEKLKDLKDRKLIFNLAIIFNERERYYEEYEELFLKYLCVINF